MRKIMLLSTILIALLLSQIHAQDSSLKDLPQGDWNFELFQKFYKTDEYVFVITDVKDKVTYEDIWRRCKSIKPDVKAIVKYENQLDEQDYRKHMFVCGPIDSFERWKSFGLPIEKIQGGFKFGPYTFTDKDDGILFLSSDASRVVYTGNSLSPLDKLLRTLGGLFQYTIVQDGAPAHFGNFINGQFDSRGHIDLRKEREKYLNRKVVSKHYEFHYSDKFFGSDTIQTKAANFDKYCDEAIDKLELDQPDYKIQCYVYSDENEKLLLSGAPGRGGVTYGKEIHVLGFDIVEHESIHVLFNSAVAQPNNNFFNEGIRQYYEYITDPNSLEEGRKTIRKYLNEPIEKWANGSIYFFGTPSENGWPVAYPASGLFVKFLIDHHGLDKFKRFYRRVDIDAGFLEVYGKPLEDMVEEWKKAEVT
jgi:hypothetical protein